MQRYEQEESFNKLVFHFIEEVLKSESDSELSQNFFLNNISKDCLECPQLVMNAEIFDNRVFLKRYYDNKFNFREIFNDKINY